MSTSPTTRPTTAITKRSADTTPSAIRGRLGPYDILGELGRGGMGVVLRGRDSSLDRDVAIKFLHTASYQKPNRRLRFVREARITGRLEHPGVVPVHQLGRDGQGREFFVMKLVAGRTLLRLLEQWHAGDAETRRDFPLTRLLTVFERVCETVEFAHANGVIHRDLKPANISVGAHGEVWVLDWGLAKTLRSDDEPEFDEDGESGGGIDATPLTAAGRIVGTPSYMSPEQARGLELDERADVFALGAVLFHVLTGRSPIAGESREALQQAARGRVLDIRRARGLPRSLTAIVRACLAADRARRYASVTALLADVRRHLAGEPVSVLPEGPAARLRRWAGRHARIVAIGGGAVALLLLTATAAAVLVAHESRQRAEAIEQAARADAERRTAESMRRGAESRAEAASRVADTAQAQRDEESAKRAHAEREAERATAEKAAAAQRRLRAFAPYAQAMDLVRRGQRLDQAAELAHSAVAIDPEFVEAAYLEGEALRGQGRPKQAAEAFLHADEASLRVVGRHAASAQLAAALAYELGGYLAESAAAYDAVDPDVTEPLAEVGRALRDLRMLAFASARARVDALCVSAPHLWEAHYARARVYLDLVEAGLLESEAGYAEAVASAQRAVELAPREALVHAQLAMCQREPAERLRVMDRAIALEPGNGAWLAKRAELKAQLGNGDGARADAEAARRLGVAPVLLAMIALRESTISGDTEANFRALGALSEQLAGWPREQMAWAYVGLGLHRDESSAVLRDLIARYPTYPTIALARASMAPAPGRAEKAIAIVRASLAEYPHHAQARLAEAFYCHLAGRHAESLTALDGIVLGLLTPNDAFLARRLGVAALVALGRPDDAERLRKRARAEFPARSSELEQPLP